MATLWTDPMMVELTGLFHLALTALGGPGPSPSRYERKLWASKQYSEDHPEVSETAAYKALCREEIWRF